MAFCRDRITLDELLDDPVTRAVMQADHVDLISVRTMLRSLAADIGNVALKSVNLDLDSESAIADLHRSDAKQSHHPSCGRGNMMPAKGVHEVGIRSYLCGAL